MSDDIRTPRKEYTDREKGLKRNRDGVAGERAVKAATTDYLSPLTGMYACTVTRNEETGVNDYSVGARLSTRGQKDYDKYLSNAAFIGYTGRTVVSLKGLINSKPATFEIPESLSYLLDDCDGAGTSLKNFVDNCVDDIFPAQIAGILTTAPETSGTNSKLDDERNNIRPSMSHYPQESIINWHYGVVKNKRQLIMLVLRESITKRNGFKIESEYQYRLLELVEGVYHQAVYNADGDIVSELSPVVMGGEFLDYIPFETIDMRRSIIEGLVDANFQHYKFYADYGAKLHSSSFSVFTEASDDTEGANMSISAGCKWTAGMGAQFGLLEPNGNVDGHKLALEATKEDMSALGADIMFQSTGANASGEAKRIDKIGTDSVTVDLAVTVSEAVTRTMKTIADISGVTEDVSYMLNTDYDPSTLDAQTIAAIGNLNNLQGLIDKEEAQHNLQKGGLIRADRDLAEMNKNIDRENNGLGAGDE